MAAITITEFRHFANDSFGGPAPAPLMPPLAEQVVAIGLTSVQSAAFSSSTTLIMVHADADCHLAFGDDPTADATLHQMGSGETRFYGVVPGSKIAVIG